MLFRQQYQWIKIQLLSLTLISLTGMNLVSHAAMIDGVDIPIHQLNSKVCEDCHQEIYMQWRGSMHAQSAALKDPIHAAFYKQVIGDPTKENIRSTKGKYPVCLQCHAPSAAKDKKTKLDSKSAYKQGVNCVSCHSLKKYKGIDGNNGKLNLGMNAYELSDKLQGSNGIFSEQGKAADALRIELNKKNDTNPHLGRDNNNIAYLSEAEVKLLDLPLQGNSLLKTSAACLGCHEKRNNSHGVPLCATGNEMVAGKSRETCQSCHMPIINGMVSHEMGGGHDLAMLKRSIRLDINIKKSDTHVSVDVIIENQQPHDVPTGAPFRNLYLKLTALDKEGNILWQNFTNHPAKEDPQAYFSYALTDDQGKPAPPPKATKKGSNTRLKPYETRLLNYTIALENVDTIRAEMYYNLLWASLVNKKLKDLDTKLKAPKKIAWREVRIQ
ncbi:MAG: cytochrome c family protein [gamma proteobacterium symbiont of Taylorina sp.]|nr:cytochrome c family protein [gamma proteobacterium symbiont of Taylorina sp.]